MPTKSAVGETPSSWLKQQDGLALQQSFHTVDSSA